MAGTRATAVPATSYPALPPACCLQVKLAVAFQEIELLHSAAVETVPHNDNPALLRCARRGGQSLVQQCCCCYCCCCPAPPAPECSCCRPRNVYTPPLDLPACPPTRRPPTAFTRKRDFSAAEPGHVVLLEYTEQQAGPTAGRGCLLYAPLHFAVAGSALSQPLVGHPCCCCCPCCSRRCLTGRAWASSSSRTTAARMHPTTTTRSSSRVRTLADAQLHRTAPWPLEVPALWTMLH